LSLRRMHDLVKARMERIAIYQDRLGGLPGCLVQDLPHDRTTSGNYFVLFISDRARRSRDEIYQALKREGIQTKRYFYPPVHEQRLVQRFPIRVSRQVAQTQKASRQALALPLYSHMTEEQIDTVCRRVEELLKDER